MLPIIASPARSARFMSVALAVALLGGCASGGMDRPATASAAQCDTKSIDSRPGRIWWTEQRWRYATDADATAAWQAIAGGADPWPDWFIAPGQELAIGTRFQMALGKGQSETSPGGFGTFDNIASVRDVRRYLAVQYAWKPEIDRVVTYEVTKALPVKIGPVGPQADPHGCRWLPGRWSQLQMTVPAPNRIDYLRVVAVRPIR
ncbi:MAG: hypothetical protein JWN66_4118 [Sphingomonas bacterium]|jgi:hypothetical protein|uniref:hypothetical protein n=1 Tax=Sphingomonas bacterium TaxID=1895847 RepID=UPI0026353610|nr:hypothetical protein [Sphingomonas bacterium]MDB5707002.1 hypothetical protein [Sphingomonas bacterium]